MDDKLTIVPGASIRSQVLEFYREAIRSEIGRAHV